MKKPADQTASFQDFEKIIGSAKKESIHFVDKTMDISNYILTLLEKKGLKQKDLARLLNKKEAEISKWMGGLHNFTLRTISAIEVALNEQIVLIPNTTHIYSNVHMVNNKSVVFFGSKPAPLPKSEWTTVRKVIAKEDSNVPVYALVS